MDGGLKINLDIEEKGIKMEKTKIQHQIDAISMLLDDLGWEYDRMSGSGQETLDKIYIVLGKDTIPETDLKLIKQTRLDFINNFLQKTGGERYGLYPDYYGKSNQYEKPLSQPYTEEMSRILDLLTEKSPQKNNILNELFNIPTTPVSTYIDK